MRHASGYRKLNRTHTHRKAMFSNMTASLIVHEQIKTTLPKAKELRRFIDRMISLGKKGTLHDRRRAFAFLRDDAAVTKLFSTLAERYQDRPGGYSRVLKAGFRYGDSAPMAVIELVDRDPDAKGAEDRARVEAEADMDVEG
ncbi:MAG: 50S ribosomal protein L17 [Rhodospirillales bacterium]|nr:50S ribosomal protein L17 [Rhodospirillales bacterium]